MPNRTKRCHTCLHKSPLCANGYCLGWFPNADLQELTTKAVNNKLLVPRTWYR